MQLIFEGNPTTLQAGDVITSYFGEPGIIYLYFERRGVDIKDDSGGIGCLSSPDQPEALINIAAACCGLKIRKLSPLELEGKRFIVEQP